MSKERNNTRAWTAEEQKIDDSNPAQLAEAKKIAGVKNKKDFYFSLTKLAIDDLSINDPDLAFGLFLYGAIRFNECMDEIHNKKTA